MDCKAEISHLLCSVLFKCHCHSGYLFTCYIVISAFEILFSRCCVQKVLYGIVIRLTQVIWTEESNIIAADLKELKRKALKSYLKAKTQKKIHDFFVNSTI